MRNTLFTSLLSAAALTMSMMSVAQAAAVETPPGDLGAVMGSMSQELKAIGLQAADATKNVDSATKSAELANTITWMFSYLPDLINGEVDVAKKEQLKHQYFSAGADLYATVIKLENAFTANDNTSAGQIIKTDLKNKMNAGHAAFNP